MALNLKDVKGRMKAINQTLSITDAMYTTSVSKLNKANNDYKKFLEFSEEFFTIIKEVNRNVESIYNSPQTEGYNFYILISSDKGLCGAYHNDLLKHFVQNVLKKEINQDGEKTKVMVIGRKGFSMLRNRKDVDLMNEKPILNRDDARITEYKKGLNTLIDLFEKNKIKNLYLVYNHSLNALSREIIIDQLLPLDIKYTKEEKKAPDKYIYEADIKYLFKELIQVHMEQKLYGALVDAKLAEHQARMFAMKSASDNAKKVLEKLTILYNRARQDQITKELIDIVNGSQRR